MLNARTVQRFHAQAGPTSVEASDALSATLWRLCVLCRRDRTCGVASPFGGSTSPARTPQPAVQGAEVLGGTTATLAGVTIVSRLGGAVTITVAEQVLTITARSGTAPFTLAPGSGAGCELAPPGAATGARCPAPPGTTFILVAATAQPVTVLPRTGTGPGVTERGTAVWTLGGAAALVLVASSTACLIARRQRGVRR